MFLPALLKIQWVGTGEGREVGLLSVQDSLSKGIKIEMWVPDKTL